MIVNSLFLRKYISNYPFSYHVISVMKCITVAIVLFIFCFVIHKIEIFNAYIRFGISSIIGLFIYVSMLYLLRVREVREVVEKLVSRTKI